MPRGSMIHDVYIADGFRDDCDELLYRCSNVDVLTYSIFCNIWKDMNFAEVFQGRQSGAEIAEVSEEFLHVAKSYMVARTSNFEESVAGLFLVYGLLNLQPYSGFAVLRLVPDDVVALKNIEDTARRDKRHDVLYILADVLFRGPCQYHIMARERGMEMTIRKYFKGWTTISGDGVLQRGVFYRQNDEMDVIRELNNITKKYSDVKLAVTGNSTIDPSLFYINEKFATELQTSLKNLINGIQEDEQNEDDEKSCPAVLERLDRVQSIKSKAMKTTVDSMRHLNTVTIKKQKLSPTKKSKLKIEEITKKGTEPKPSTSKRFASPVKAPVRLKKKKTSESSSDSDADISMEKANAEEGVDLNLEEFKNASAIEIEIDKVPIFSGKDGTKVVSDNQEYTIEIIDQYVPNKQKCIEDKTEVKLKRKLKNPVIQSRFKRMGMLSLANFREESTNSKSKSQTKRSKPTK